MVLPGPLHTLSAESVATSAALAATVPRAMFLSNNSGWYRQHQEHQLQPGVMCGGSGSGDGGGVGVGRLMQGWGVETQPGCSERGNEELNTELVERGMPRERTSREAHSATGTWSAGSTF